MASEKIRLQIVNILESLKGKRLLIKVHKGRKKYVSFYGKIEDVCPFVFTIKEEKEDAQVQSFSFSDLITKDVVLSLK